MNSTLSMLWVNLCILSDLGSAYPGTVDIAQSGNVKSEGRFSELVSAVYNSARDVGRKGMAIPISMICAGPITLDHFGFKDAASTILNAIEDVLS